MDFSIIDKIKEDSKSFTKPLNKQKIVDYIVSKYNLKKERKLYLSQNLSIRFSSSKSGYSNTFLGLKKILENDTKPLIACIIREKQIEFLIANSTFINCISHSSKLLTTNNIKGSANLSNIIKEFSEMRNEPSNFNKLFELHNCIPQKDNIERIVHNTQNIKSKGKKYNPSESQSKIIHGVVEFTKSLENDSEFINFKNLLIQKVYNLKFEILETSKIDNVNIRGNKIEQILTKGVNSHDLGDILQIINNDNKIIIDIKSKLLNASSSPAAYNIDKLLEAISVKKTYFGYLFIGINDEKKEVKAELLSFIDNFLIDNTNIQHHWSGRNSRGTTQLNDNIKNIFLDNFESRIDTYKAGIFIDSLIKL